MMKRIPVKYPIKRGRGQRGQAIALIALSMMVLIAFVALGVEANSLFELKRRAQNAADAAAVAAAYARCQRLYDAQTDDTDAYYQYDGKSQPSTSPSGGLEKVADDLAKAKAITIASANDFTDGVNNVTVTVQPDPDTNVPYYSGSTTAHSHNYIQVIIGAIKPKGLLGVFFQGTAGVEARATGWCSLWVTPAGLEDAGVAALDTGCGTSPCDTNKSVKTTGSGGLYINNGHLITNSAETGTNCSVSAGGNGGIHVTGTAPSSGTATQIKNAANPATDGVCANGGGSVDAVGGIVHRDYDTTSPTGSIPVPGEPASCISYSGSNITLNDGACVDGNITLGNGDTLTCGNNALIYFKTGSLKTTNGATINCPHAFFYFSPNAGSISTSGNSTVVNFGGPTGASAGGNYTHLAYWQNNANSSSNQASFSGGSLTMEGTFFIQNNSVQLSGGSSDVYVTAQIICDTLEVSGSANIHIEYDPTVFYTPPPTTTEVI